MTARLPARKTDPFGILLALIASGWVLTPFFSGNHVALTLSRIAIELTIIAAVIRMQPSRRLIAFVVLVAITNEATIWAQLKVPNRVAVIISDFSSLLFIATAFSLIARNAWRARSVNASLFAAVIAAYFMLGYFFGTSFALLEFLEPGSFAGACAEAGRELNCEPERGIYPRLHYLSFVTMTTLGYGDVLPLTRRAEGFTTMASVVGQLYIAILIGRIISISVTQTKSDD